MGIVNSNNQSEERSTGLSYEQDNDQGLAIYIPSVLKPGDQVRLTGALILNST